MITLNGKPLNLLGSSVACGQPAPEFRVVDGTFSPVRLADYKGRRILISVVPSLDTGVCNAQTKRFNEEVGKLSNDLAALTISTDLPFAQARFCETEKVDRIRVLSDCVDHNFGLNYGVLIEGHGLLARAIFIIDRDGTVAYREIVPELTDHPNYDQAITALKQ